MRGCGVRLFLGTFATAEAAAEAADLGRMLLVGGSPAAARGLNLAWDGVSEEQLRAKQAPLLHKLLERLQGRPGPAAAKLVKTLQDKNAGLLQQQQEQEQQRQTSAGQQQRRRRRQSTTQQQQQQQQGQPQSQQQQQQQQQQQSHPARQQQPAAAQQAQGQGGEPRTPQPGPAPLLRIVLELQEEAGQQWVTKLQSIAGFCQQAASIVQQALSGAKRSAEDAPTAAGASRRRLRL
jgi:hypothetical protein